MTQSLSIQEYYAPEFSHCWGCGQAHPSGLHLRSYMAPDGASATCTTMPPDIYTGGVPSNLYGGFIAMLFDCHGTASAAGFYLAAHHIPLNHETLERFVTAHLEVDYLRPTPMNCALKVVARPLEVTDRKAVLEMELWAGEVKTATAKMVAVRFVKK
ncbi:PaaI family thioesterase [Porphyromonas endodontalis]|uniref:PaaI family thioesterase n=1 Tax=Porphyromonas endodontalis TaxID=28124 RepID=UPI0028EE46C2|nr:PaaI family thioesterase [Porphyromonas endodontalis]